MLRYYHAYICHVDYIRLDYIMLLVHAGDQLETRLGGRDAEPGAFPRRCS